MKILVVDDELDKLDALLAFFEEEKAQKRLDFFYALETYLEEMLSTYRTQLPWIPDVILLDLMMPLNRKSTSSIEPLGGEVFLNNLRQGHYEPQLPAQTPVVVLSGYANAPKFISQYRKKVSDVLIKPASIKEIYRALQSAITPIG